MFHLRSFSQDVITETNVALRQASEKQPSHGYGLENNQILSLEPDPIDGLIELIYQANSLAEENERLGRLTTMK